MSKGKNNKKNIKSKWILGVAIGIFVIVGVIYAWNTYSSKQYSSGNYDAERTVAENENDDNNNQESNDEEQVGPATTPEPEPEPEPTPAPTPAPVTSEEQISTFSTKIYNKEQARQNNINITCSSLNDTIIANGATFSFCNTVGPATTQKGYQKADIFDKNGRKKKGLGGGNCQISTTLYNAVASIPSINITERHQHSNYVPYIEKGKDAAVAYGGYDLKFVNSTGYDIKIKASSDGNSVNISIIKLKYD